MESTPSTRRKLIRANASVGALLLTLAASPSGAADSPWTLLTHLREALEAAGPVTARFTQTYIPAGFSDGDQETGHLSLLMPDCLRWNYDEGKSFLICGETVHQWNEDEPGGRIFAVDPAAEPGLDLLLVDVPLLRERYRAESADGEPGALIVLTLPADDGGDLTARIQLDAAGERVTRMEYTDSAGDLSRFEIEAWQALEHEALFKPPVGREWTQE